MSEQVTNALLEALRLRHEPRKNKIREWAFFPQVRSTAWGARTVDALALNLWESRGHAVHGFEIKASRADWLKELQAPDKAETFARFCDFWWLVTIPDIVKAEELPATWGLLLLRGAGLRVQTKAEKRKPKPLTKDFVVEIIRQLHVQTSLENVSRHAFAEGRESGREAARIELDARSRKIKDLEAKILTFENAAGFKIQEWSHDADQIGKAVHLVLSGADEVERNRTALRNLHREAKRIAEFIERVVGSQEMSNR